MMAYNNLNDFLKELAELSQKYDIYIAGCGCCGSPYLYSLKDDRLDDEHLTYDERKKIYTVEDSQ